MVRALGIFWGIAFLFGGILGFVPGITDDDMFLGIFMVNTPHSILHIASGVAFLIASLLGARTVRLWFQIFGIVYAALAAMGFIVGDGMIFNLISNNQNDSWGHLALAFILLLIGFAGLLFKKQPRAIR
jgi:drug/metabolite transporter (DMT)-like permease